MTEQGDNPTDPWAKALEDIDLSGLDRDREEEYPQISQEEIDRVKLTNPFRSDMMQLANEVSDEARARAEGRVWREKENHKEGWSVAMETPRGIVGLWSCWLGNQFFLGFPKDIRVPEALISRTLGVEPAPDDGQRQWARFRGHREIDGGRVWIDYSQDNSSSFAFPLITEKGEMTEIFYGYNLSKGISTYPFSFFSEYGDDAPTNGSKAIQRYKDGFLRLAGEIATLMGGIRAINVNYGFALIPEDLHRENYQEITWLKGEEGRREGWGKEIVRARKGDSTVILKSGNSLVPWSTTRRVPLESSPKPEAAVELIKEILYF